jgi:outer membrane protein OmpA-like peptidoglycan-associated protein
MRPILFMLTIGLLASPAAAGSADAQFTSRVTERIKQKVAERKLQAEESAVGIAAEPADSAMAKVSAPVESLTARVGGAAGAAVGGLGRGKDAARQEATRLRQELAAGRADLPAVRFEPGTATLDPSSELALQPLSLVLTELSGAFLVQGRADPGTSPPEVSGLPAARAAAIKTWLVGTGIPAARVFAAGDGAAAPDAPLVTVVSMQ